MYQKNYTKNVPEVYCPYCKEKKEAERWTLGDELTFNYKCTTCSKEFKWMDIIKALYYSDTGFTISTLNKNY
jgi:DNA-directed RNA polymerase subunit RPC12/RpoP